MMRRRQMLTRAEEERLRAENRRKDYQRVDHMKMVAQDKLLRANMACDDRVEKKRFSRRIQQEAQEREINDRIIAAAQERELREKQIEQEERLAKELEKLKWESQKDERMRQQIRENSVELRELEAKLKAGYMNKERAAQMAEKDLLIEKDKQYEAIMAAMMKKEYEKATELEIEKEQEKYEQSVQYQEQLQKQLQEKEQQQREAYEEFLKEKLMIDEIVRKIYEEDQREAEARLERQKATQNYVAEFLKKREEWKEHERMQMEEENRRILEFSRIQQEREEERMKLSKAFEESKAAVQNKLAEEIATALEEGKEMERIRMELYLEEEEEKERQKEKSALEAQIRQRLDLQSAHKDYLIMKERKRQAEKEEEEEFRQQMIAKFAEDDRLELMNAQKRRMKQLEHRRAVEKLIEERRQQYQLEKDLEILEHQEEERLEAVRRGIIEQERQRLLKEHATKLLGYLPKGVLRDDEDLSVLGEEFKQAYKKRQVNLFDDEGW